MPSHTIAWKRAANLAVAYAVVASCYCAAAAELDFAREVAPIFQQHCLKCHGDKKQQGGLRFDMRQAALQPGDSGNPAIVPGKADASELIRRVTATDDDQRMPPEGDRLSDQQIAVLRRWIDEGADWPETASGPDSPGRQELQVTDEDRQHWSFRPLQPGDVPPVDDQAWARTSIDRFILAKLEQQGLRPNAIADPRTLVRRIYFDLIGLPPTIQQAEDFAAASARDPYQAVAQLVDHLLASPHYGERWARHWLDVARYADSNGQEGDQDRPYAYQYRDFVIRALNDDLPYDKFLQWQIAGDELEPDNPLAVAATGFWTAGPHTVLDVPMEEEKIRNRYNELDDMLSTFGSGMLGLTLGCARCHDHKYDPIPTRDYYRLLSVVHSGTRQEAWLGTRSEIASYTAAHGAWQEEHNQAKARLKDWIAQQRRPLESTLREAKIAQLSISEDEKKILREQPDSDEGRRLSKQHEQALATSEDNLRDHLNDEQRSRWDELRSAVELIERNEPPPLPKALVFRDTTAEPKPTWLFHRADFYDHSEPVSLGFLSVLTRSKPAETYWAEARSRRTLDSSTYQRAALARWITDVDQGAGALAARVAVNRLWQHHFGEGLVRTVSDFGTQGERPTHPELLEWLARDLVEHGWKLKRLHRNILLSSVYLQDTSLDEARSSVDPENRLLGRRRPLRLQAEILRDAMLAAAGSINLQPYGPSFKPPIMAEAVVARNLKSPYTPEPADSPNVRRRSVYMFHKRVVPYPLLQAFDRPDALQSCGRRDTTTVAPQALALLNDPFIRDRAVEFADRLLRESGADPEEPIKLAFALALSRPPRDTELPAARQFVEDQIAKRKTRDGTTEHEARRAALADFCQVLFGLNEFLYVD